MIPLTFCVFFGLCLVSWCLVQQVRRWTQRWQIYDIPNDRSSHTQPTPRGGGLSIVAISLSGWGVLMAFGVHEDIFGMSCFVVGVAMLAVISCIDDVLSLPEWLRFAVQAVAAILLIVGYGENYVFALPLLGDIQLGILGYVVLFLWGVGLSNVYNFMDGIDGIAAVQAIVAGLGWMVLSQDMQSPDAVFWLALFLTTGNLGFLIHNWPPAKIFMGDIGSVFCGFSFAYLAIAAGQENPRMYVAGALLVWPFVADSAFTFFRRAWNRENVFHAHRQHLYQRLTKAGWSHRSTTLFYGALDLCGAGFAIAFVRHPGGGDWLAVFGTLGLAGGLWCLTVWQEKAFAVMQKRSQS
jgi:UDP-N-acetylmuramyl pentapeptide phosphotransferase/UDP-N-acetylglucosamine-1-phosphate transferase